MKMGESINEKFVEFDEYCLTCKFKDVDQGEEPCNECLHNPINMNSVKPVNYQSSIQN